jgi:bis(5'-nucleosidyl)-tetraphosphatase
MAPNTRREISAGIVVYRRTKEGLKFLLLYHGGRYWNFPKGHLELIKLKTPTNRMTDKYTVNRPASESEASPKMLESSFKAAVRETCEETGLQQKDLILRRGFRAYERYIFFNGKTRVTKTVVFYLAETKKRQIKISDEHEGFGWFKYNDARRLLAPYRENETVLKKAYDIISLNKRVPEVEISNRTASRHDKIAE